METENDRSEDPTSPASDQLKALRDAQVLTYTRYPPSPGWYAPAFGVVMAAFVAGYAAPRWLGVGIWLLVFLAIVVWVRWTVDRRGIRPDQRHAPASIRRETTIMLIGYCVTVVAIVATFLFVSWWAATIVTFGLATTLIAVYEARYDRAAREVEAELADQTSSAS